MTKLAFIITVTLLGVSFATAQDKTSDRAKAGLSGPVKSLRSVSIDYSGEKIVGEGFMKREGDRVSYDAAGRETDRVPVSDYGDSMGKISRIFDQQGLLAESSWVDAKGKLLKRDVFRYTDGRLSETLTYTGAGDLLEKTVHAYDGGGRLEAEIYYDRNKPIARTVYRYGDKSKPIEISFFMADGSKATAPVGPCLGAHRMTLDYNDKGKNISQTAFEADGTQKKRYRWKYDDRGNIVEYFTETEGSTVNFVYKYEFDTRGNWIKRVSTGTTLEKGQDVFGMKPTPYVRSTVTVREITYY